MKTLIKERHENYYRNEKNNKFANDNNVKDNK